MIEPTSEARPFLIDTATLADVPEIERLLERVWPNWLDVLKRPLSDILANPCDAILVARAGGELCGCIVLSEGLPWSCLHALAVLPASRRQGLGSSLIRNGVALHSHLAFGGLVSAFVKWNSPQSRLFERAGFLAVPYDRAPAGHHLVVLDQRGETPR